MTSAGSAPSADAPEPSRSGRTGSAIESVDLLQSSLGVRWRDPALLRQALTHRSFGQPHNERLEFLGDSVLNCAMARLLFDRFAHLDEGDLSRLRSNLVKQQSLFEIAQSIQLGRFVRLGEGELRSGGPRRPSILGDTLEAIFGAVFLDSGYDATFKLIEKLYTPVLSSINPETLGKDAKTLLQEFMQSRKFPLPAYTVVATHGAAHNQTFEVECTLSRLGITVLGSGTSRRAAEQAAARQALEQARAPEGAELGGRRIKIKRAVAS